MGISPLKAVVLISGRGSNLHALIRAQQAGTLDIDFAAVISNRPEAAGLQLAAAEQITTEVVDHTLYEGRTAYDQALIKVIDQHQPELLILAGFMRILTPELVRHYAGRLINIHPSLLPRFKGLHTHQQALDAGATTHGASVHFVSEELDGGPVFLQASVAVEADDEAERLAARVLEQEHRLYPAAIQLIAEGRIRLVDDSLQLDQTPLHEPLQLSS
ncbi:MAG: phosphoribosylglycinamide formyltransferase [Gammaproteobacteria bacterium]|jgi:phosphoribosylglycinamide formyltransferase-1|nr:phosphoribosylglycinamide formyltransferase [Gammaproteobacteria bacterium]MBT4606363.1 phosphoribosylglycinamide formyltransferase [Thiotrichales bacterium]MBT3472508.1 phosphoribosylglycinamide formyltransferase [Gammaproteobacteria bacterium]MBT3967728.1 phosphoribosylglycinamide formyltransferase [Gammaproteobacteria bacterium]MBT4081467.1 phosphoribosylglycinamide formyltransferase [Gammaproteobacteria bacterium]